MEVWKLPFRFDMAKTISRTAGNTSYGELSKHKVNASSNYEHEQIHLKVFSHKPKD
jgi:hypothetical protein